jgi:ADP-heptose:LPS heptosyltransferase
MTASMAALQIADPRERRLVSAADRLLQLACAPRAWWRPHTPSASPKRILLLRLERIGDLLMVLPAIADLRATAPDAAIDLVVGSWNRALAETIPGVTRVESLDAQWLARGSSGLGMSGLLRRARSWRERHYDLAINFEPDIRSNLLLAASGAAFTAGYASGGGGALLDRALTYDPRAHTTENARRLIAEVVHGARASAPPVLRLADEARRTATARLSAAARGPLVGIHVSAGRAVKQWEPVRFADTARQLVASCGATIVLTGAPEDAALVEAVRAQLPDSPLIDVSGDIDLTVLAAILERLDLLITGDTGPMHLAVAMGTPVVAIFGPSDPARYGPRGPHDRIVRVDLPCSPCNRIRQPPERCTGHTPDCLSFLPATLVMDAALDALAASGALHGAHAGRA